MTVSGGAKSKLFGSLCLASTLTTTIPSIVQRLRIEHRRGVNRTASWCCCSSLSTFLIFPFDPWSAEDNIGYSVLWLPVQFTWFSRYDRICQLARNVDDGNQCCFRCKTEYNRPRICPEKRGNCNSLFVNQ